MDDRRCDEWTLAIPPTRTGAGRLRSERTIARVLRIVVGLVAIANGAFGCLIFLLFLVVPLLLLSFRHGVPELDWSSLVSPATGPAPRAILTATMLAAGVCALRNSRPWPALAIAASSFSLALTVYSYGEFLTSHPLTERVVRGIAVSTFSEALVLAGTVVWLFARGGAATGTVGND